MNVLVLGAGASAPYGFPTGEELREKILDRFNIDSGEEENDDVLGILKRAARDRFQESEFKRDDIREFRRLLWDAQDYTIDAFLGRNSNFEKLGKFAIAYCLLKSERADKLLNTGGWYKRFRSFLFPPGGLPRICKVVTFNYDRSLQHYLTNAVVASMGLKSREQGAQIVFDSTFINPVHGGITREVGPEFGKATIEDIAKFAETIRLPHQITREEIAIFGGYSTARDTIAEADTIFFLGFGFDRENLGRLFYKADLKGKRIVSTSNGLTPKKKTEIQETLNTEVEWMLPGENAMEQLIQENLLR